MDSQSRITPQHKPKRGCDGVCGTRQGGAALLASWRPGKGGGLSGFQIPTPPPPSRPPKVFAPGWGLEFEQAAPLAPRHALPLTGPMPSIQHRLVRCRAGPGPCICPDPRIFRGPLTTGFPGWCTCLALRARGSRPLWPSPTEWRGLSRDVSCGAASLRRRLPCPTPHECPPGGERGTHWVRLLLVRSLVRNRGADRSVDLRTEIAHATCSREAGSDAGEDGDVTHDLVRSVFEEEMWR